MANPLLAYIRDSVQSLTPYKGGKSLSEAANESTAKELIKLASNECPYPTGIEVRKALAHAATSVNLYPDGNATELKEKLAEKYNMSSNQITIGNGSNEILELLVLALCDGNRQDNLLTTTHAFLVYKLLAATHGIGFIEAPLHNWQTDTNALLERIDENTRIICVANPANPTGTSIDNATLYKFLEKIPSTTLLLLDQAYADFYPSSDECLSWLDQFKNLVITRTFSKAVGLAGMRVGYCFTNTELTDILNRVRQPFNVSQPAQAAALAALEDTKTLEHTIANNQLYRGKLQQLCSELNIATLPGDANFITLDFLTPEKANQIENRLLQEGIIIRNLANYQMPSMLRISIGTPEQMERLFAAMRQICA